MKVTFEKQLFEERKFAAPFDPLPSKVWKEEHLALVQDDEAGNVVVTKVTEDNLDALTKAHKHAYAAYQASLAPSEVEEVVEAEEVLEAEVEPSEDAPKKKKKKGLFGKSE